jgi:cysteine dioxygenase
MREARRDNFSFVGWIMSSSNEGRLCSIDEFVAALRRLPASAFDVTPGPVQQCLREHPVTPDSLQPYLCWDRQHYTRNLIDKTELYELIAICWEVGQQSSIHNHHNQNCWMAAPIGRLVVQNYRAVFEDITAGKCNIAPTYTVEITPANPAVVDPAEPIHKVVNPLENNERAVTLHVYSRPFDRCVVYAEEQGTCGEIELRNTTEYGRRPERRS